MEQGYQQYNSSEPEAAPPPEDRAGPTSSAPPTAVANPDGTVTGSDGKPINQSAGGPGEKKRFGPLTPQEKADAEGKPCVYCGNPMTGEPGKPNSVQQDHGIPKVKGGNNTDDNNNLACQQCNASKGSKSVWDWVKQKFGNSSPPKASPPGQNSGPDSTPAPPPPPPPPTGGNGDVPHPNTG